MSERQSKRLCPGFYLNTLFAVDVASGMDRYEAEGRARTGSGMDDYDVEVFVTHFLQIATGELAGVSDAVPRLTGHSAQSLSEYLQQHPESYQHLLTD